MGKIWRDLRAVLVQKRQPRRSHQILSSEFGKDGWVTSGVICALCFFREDSRADHTRFGPVKLRRVAGQILHVLRNFRPGFRAQIAAKLLLS